MSRYVLRLVWIVFASSLPGVLLGQNASRQATDSSELPNIVLLVADDLGYGELTYSDRGPGPLQFPGNAQIPTPHIDDLARSGVVCTQAYVTAPNCSPSRAGFLTGRTPTRFGYEFNPIGARNEDSGTGIPAAQTTLAELLREVGYTTGLIGKWHLGGAADYHPLRHGFDEFFGFLHEGHYFAPAPWPGITSFLRRRHLPVGSQERYTATERLIYSAHMGHDEPPYDANNPILRGGQPVEEVAYLTDAFTREATSFITRHRETPFFLCLTYNAVHSPLQAKDETLAGLGHIEDIHRRIFAGMLSDLDHSVGAVMGALDELELREKTLVFFLSDNGGPTRELTSSNLPLRDGKGSMYEGGIRIPFIVSWPTQIPTGQACHAVVSSMDILATAAAASGAQVPEYAEGQDLLPLLNDPMAQSRHKTLYWRQGKRAALRHGNWKIVSPGLHAQQRIWELYDMGSDISERENLASKNPSTRDELQRIWEELDRQMAEPLF